MNYGASWEELPTASDVSTRGDTIPPPMNIPPPSTPAIQESRKRYALFYPSRSSVPLPGAGSVFGRGFLRRLRASGGGCFLLIFLTIGLFMCLFGLAGTAGPFRDGLRDNADPRFFMVLMALGAVFVLMPLRMLQITLRQTQSAEFGKRPADPKAPWASDYPWQPEAMLPDYAGDLGGSFLGTIGFLGFIGVFNMVFFGGPVLLKIVAVVLDLLGLALLFSLILKTWQILRHPRTRMRWATFPAFLGDRLEGTLTVRPGQHIFSALTVKLRCIQEERREGYQGDVGLEPHVIYEQTLDVTPPGETLTDLPLSFQLPDDLPGTALSRSEPIYWQVAVRIPVTGPDIEAIFLAPVYAKS